MNRRNALAILFTFLVGLLAGMVLVGASEDLSDALFGTAGDGKKDRELFAYYQVPLDEVQAWLAETYPDTMEDLKAPLETMAKFVDDATLFDRDFSVVEEDISTLLPYAYGALVGLDEKELAEPENLKIDEESGLSLCVALDDDPYLGASLHLYITVPKDQLEDLNISKQWKPLKDPKTNALYWTLLACLPELEKPQKAAKATPTPKSLY